MLLIRRIRYAMVVLAVLVVGWLVWQARGGFIPFIVGAILAYILTPLVDRLTDLMPFHRKRYELARTLAIVIIYLTGFGILFLAGSLLIPALIDEALRLADEIPNYIQTAQDRAQEWSRLYEERVPEDVKVRVEEWGADLGAAAGQYGQEAIERTLGFLTSTFSLVFGYVTIPFWLFYILKDRHKIGPAIQQWFPEALREDVGQCFRIVQRVLGSYIRAQLTLALFIGGATTIFLWAIGIESYIVLGLIAGITEMIPVIGPIFGGLVAIIVVLATEPDKVLWVLIFVVALQQVENAVLVPRIQGNAVEMHPALIIVLLMVAQQVAGFLGMLVCVPLAALARDLFRYIYGRLEQRERELARPRLFTTAEAQQLASGEPATESAHPSTGPGNPTT